MAGGIFHNKKVCADLGITLLTVAAIDVWKGIGLATLIHIAGIAAIPADYFEAARVDGAGPVRSFIQVIMPLLKPVIVTIVVVQSFFVPTSFQNPLYHLPGDQNATVQLTLVRRVCCWRDSCC